MTQGILNNLNLSEINYYPFMISLDKCDGSWNIVDTLYTKICVLSETKGINFKMFNVPKRLNKAKNFVKHLLRNCKCHFNTTTCNSKQKWDNEKCKCECKKYCMCKKRSWNLSTCTCEISMYLKSIVHDSVIKRSKFDELCINNVTKIMPTNV